MTKKGNGYDEASKFAPSRGVLLVARGNLPRVYYPSFCFLPPSGFLTFLFSLFLRGLHSLKLNSPFSGGRVRSKKQRSGAGPSESMDSSEVGDFPPVGPPSTIGVDEVANWQEKYHLSDDVVIKIPGPIDIISNFKVDEVPVLLSCTSRVSPLSGAHLVDIPSVDPSLGEKTIKQVLELPIERRQLPFLVSKEALERCSIWGKLRSLFLFTANNSLRCISAVLQVICRDPKVKRRWHSIRGLWRLCRRRKLRLRRPPLVRTTMRSSSSKKKSRASGFTPRVSPSSSSDPATVLANLNTKMFPLTPVILPDGDSSASIQLIQGDLLQAMSQLFHLGERMGDHASFKADLAELNFQLREEKDNVLAKEKEIKALKLKGAVGAAGGGVCDLRCAAETFDAEKTIAVSVAIVVARWELMREWLNHQTDSWDLEGALKQYNMVKTFEAEFQGLPAPTFEGEPSIPSGTETEKTPEPVTDDPPAS
ncbi:hypothetical protein HID58_066596 [Brassica napus]|uniref:Uncharacterized protein n=1 Tax=Brassica napus TaxID=3708 RepID=A0ABQ7ZGL7_BRANA|nr:hypothetical protein HID58_066596 [Brassica napus]